MDLEEQTPQDRLQVTAYGDGGFRVLDERFDGSILITPDGVAAWPVTTMDDLDLDGFRGLAGQVDVLIIGTGARHEFVPPSKTQALQELGISVDFMGTGPACRTFNILQAEGRHVAAALIAVE